MYNVKDAYSRKVVRTLSDLDAAWEIAGELDVEVGHVRHIVTDSETGAVVQPVRISIEWEDDEEDD